MSIVPHNIIESPFTDEQQADLCRYQACKTLHPYTCPSCSVPLGVSSILFCPNRCGYVQEWARTEGLELAKFESEIQDLREENRRTREVMDRLRCSLNVHPAMTERLRLGKFKL